MSILKHLSDKRIFSIEKNKKTNKFDICEECDGAFWAELTAEEVRQLSLELLQLTLEV